MAFTRWLKQNSISLIFASAMVGLSGAIILSTTKSTGLCGGDPNFTTCLRNWVSAGGNLVTVLVAALALAVAWGQLKANASMAELPILNQRITTARTAALVAAQFINHIDLLSEILSELLDEADGQSTDSDILSYSEIIVREWNAVYADSSLISRIAGEVLDIDLEEQIMTMTTTRELLRSRAWYAISLCQNLLDARAAAESHVDPTAHASRVKLATDRIRTGGSHFWRAVKVCREEVEAMRIVAESLNRIISDAKSERQKLRLR